jgi:hypothetical protein
MHEPKLLRCIFGCRDEHDDLGHYLQCNILWSIIGESFTGLIAPLPVGRVNLVNPSLVNVTIISLAFEIYHALKIGLRETINHSQATRRYGEVCRISRKLMHEKLGSLYINDYSAFRRDSGNPAGQPLATLAGVVCPGGSSEEIVLDAQS